MTKFKRNAQSQPKHGKPSVSSASKAPVAAPVRRPGWTGPSYIRKVAKQTPEAVKQKSSTEQIQCLPVAHQQLILDTIRTTFPAVDEFNTLIPVLRAVREALEERDYCKAFGTQEFLEAYTIRWSPSRALTSANVLAWICSQMTETAWVQQFLHNDGQKPSRILCIGRGGSDLLACAALLKHSHQSRLDEAQRLGSPSPDALPHDSSSDIFSQPENGYNGKALLELNLIDMHDWSGIVEKLQHTLTQPPPLSKYATAKARASNISAIPPHALNLKVNKLDILGSESTNLCAMIGPTPSLITLFFTLHELYSISVSKTTAFLLRLTAAAPRGSLLLIVDRPGADVSFPGRSNTGQEKRYPIEWLLYQALLPPRSRLSDGTTLEEEEEGEEQPAWAKVIDGAHEKEYKLPAGLKYPGSLENTPFQVHLLERL